MSKIHQGHNIKRLREALDMKEETLAATLGDDWTTKKIAQLEQKEEVDPAILTQVAKALNVPAEVIRNFGEEATVNIVSNNTFENLENSQPMLGMNNNNECTVNDREILTQLLDRLTALEKEKIEIMKLFLEKTLK